MRQVPQVPRGEPWRDEWTTRRLRRGNAAGRCTCRYHALVMIRYYCPPWAVTHCAVIHYHAVSVKITWYCEAGHNTNNTTTTTTTNNNNNKNNNSDTGNYVHRAVRQADAELRNTLEEGRHGHVAEAAKQQQQQQQQQQQHQQQQLQQQQQQRQQRQ